MRVVVLLQKLGLELGDIDGGRALALARLAGEAEIHDLFDFRAVEGVPRVGRMIQDVPQDVGTRTRGVLLLARGHVARAHRAPGQMRLAAVAGPVAFLGCPHHAADIAEIEHRRVIRSRLARLVPEVGVHRRRVHDLAGVENVLRVERRLHRLHHRVALLADHQRDKLAAKAPVAVLAAERPAVFFDEVRDVGRDVAEHFAPGFGLEVEKRARVQLARSGVGVIDAVDAVFVAQDGVELAYVVRQVAHVHGRVLDDFARLGVAGHVAHEPLTGAAQLPDLRAFLAAQHGGRVAVACGLPAGLQRGHGFLKRGLAVAPQLHDEDRPRVADDERAVALLREVRLGAVEDVPVNELAGRGRMFNRNQVSAQGFVHRREMPAHQRGMRRRQRVAVQLELDPEKKRALGTGYQAAKVEIVRRRGIQGRRVHEQVERVARVAARDGRPRKIVRDEPAVAGVPEKLARGPVNPALRTARGALFRERLRPERPQRGLGPVAEKPARRHEVVARAAIDDRVRSARVVADHAADHGAVGRGGFGSENEPVLREFEVQLVAHHARLHARASALAVNADDLVEMRRQVHHQPVADHLPGKGGSGRARDDPDPVPRGKQDDFPHIRLGFREGDPEGHLLVFRRVRRIQPPHREPRGQLARQARAQLLERRSAHSVNPSPHARRNSATASRLGLCAVRTNSPAVAQPIVRHCSSPHPSSSPKT